MRIQPKSSVNLAQAAVYSCLPLSLTLPRKTKAILVVDDTSSTRTLLTFHLQQAGYTVWSAASSAEALTLVEQLGLPHLALIDLQLADLPGLTLAHLLQQQGALPILFISTPQPVGVAKTDLLYKPLVISALLAQVQQCLPDEPPTSGQWQESRVDDRLTLNFGAHYAIVDQQPIPLTPAESCLLACLYQHRGQVLSHAFLHEQIRAADPNTRSALPTYVYYLRQKLEAHQAHRRYIRTVPGQGYLMPLVPVDRQPAVRITIPRRVRA